MPDERLKAIGYARHSPGEYDYPSLRTQRFSIERLAEDLDIHLVEFTSDEAIKPSDMTENLHWLTTKGGIHRLLTCYEDGIRAVLVYEKGRLLHPQHSLNKKAYNYLDLEREISRRGMALLESCPAMFAPELLDDDPYTEVYDDGDQMDLFRWTA